MQNSVAELMAAAVVEILEEVDVDHENGDAVMNLRKVANQFVEARPVVVKIGKAPQFFVILIFTSLENSFRASAVRLIHIGQGKVW